MVGADGKGIGGVSVSVREEGKTSENVALSTSTDDRGKFALKGLPTGSVDLVAKSIAIGNLTAAIANTHQAKPFFPNKILPGSGGAYPSRQAPKLFDHKG